MEQSREPTHNSRGTSAPVPMISRLETYVLILALFILITGGAYLSSSMQERGTGAETLVSAAEPGGPAHAIQWAIAFGICFALIIWRWRSVAAMALRMKLLSAIGLLAAMSFLWSVQPLLSLRSGIYLLFNTLLVFYVMQRLSLQDLMRILVGLGTAVAALSIFTAVALPSYGWGKGGTFGMALQGVFLAKNLLGNNAVLLLTPALFLKNMSFRARAAYICVFLGLIALSFSVQAWIAALFCLFFAAVRLLFRRLRTRDLLWIAYATLVPMLIAVVLLLTYWADIIQFLGKDPTLSGRTIIWGAVLQAILKRPLLGWGYQAFWQGFTGESGAVLLIIHFPISQSQDGLLEVLLGVGVIGLIAVLATLAQAFRDVARCFRRGASDAGTWYLLIVLLTIYYSVGEANLLIPNTLQWIMYMMACVGLSLEAKRYLPARKSAATPVPSHTERYAPIHQ
jgi:exopolysaccharide production protein ExoQ